MEKKMKTKKLRGKEKRTLSFCHSSRTHLFYSHTNTHTFGGKKIDFSIYKVTVITVMCVISPALSFDLCAILCDIRRMFHEIHSVCCGMSQQRYCSWIFGRAIASEITKSAIFMQNHNEIKCCCADVMEERVRAGTGVQRLRP